MSQLSLTFLNFCDNFSDFLIRHLFCTLCHFILVLTAKCSPASMPCLWTCFYCRPCILKISVHFCLHAFLCHCLINTDEKIGSLHISSLLAPQGFWRGCLSARCFISTHGLTSHSVHSHGQTPQDVQTKPSHFPMQTCSSTFFMSAGAKSSAQAWRQNMDNFLTLLYPLLVFTTADW